MDSYLGLDVGSVSTNLVLLDEDNRIQDSLYLRTRGEPIRVIQEGLEEMGRKLGDSPVRVQGVGTTGSARHLAGVVVGADVVKNEITAHAVAANLIAPGVQTVLEVGGQDSKIIILRHGVVADFAMNTVCAAGTGSFLDHQAARLNIPIEKFGELALKSKNPVQIAGRCSVFAESDMVHKQQVGHSTEDIIAGLCDALVRNYLNNVGKGKDIQSPIVFQGGVAANVGIKAAFEKALQQEVIVPQPFAVMGALGAALMAKEAVRKRPGTKFRGFELSEFTYETSSFECQGCPNICEIVNIYMDGELLARWGSRCGKWDSLVETAL